MGSSILGAAVGGSSNRIEGSTFCGAIGGGFSNLVSDHSDNSTVAGGSSNRIDGHSGASAIGGGYSNLVNANSDYAVIAGGEENHIAAGSDHSVIGGGKGNVISATAVAATIPVGSCASATFPGQQAYASGCFATGLLDDVGSVHASLYLARNVTAAPGNIVRIRVKGEAGKAIRWVASVRSTEVSWGPNLARQSPGK